MSILTKEDRKDLVWAMRTSLLEQVKNVSLTEGASASARNFIINEATYEQLLNLAFNPERETNYKSIEVLEQVAVEEYAQVVQEDLYVTPEEFAKANEEEAKARHKFRKTIAKDFVSGIRHPINSTKGTIQFLKDRNMITGEKRKK